jgi:dTDP-glucose 4,6-dehydratase
LVARSVRDAEVAGSNPAVPTIEHDDRPSDAAASGSRKVSPKALVTGGAGFLGSHACERLLADGWEVIAVDNLSTGRERNLAAVRTHPAFSFHRLDVAVDPLPGEGFDAVLHLACPASPLQYTRLPLETLEVSSSGTRAALQAARRDGASFLLASTSEVYGDPLVHPQPETYGGNVDPVGPRSMYEEGKRFAEALATWYGRVHGTDVRIVRIFNTYGPRMDLWDGRVVCTFVRQALTNEPLTIHGDGSQTRSFCYASDLVEGIVRATTAPPGEVNERPTNLGNPYERTVLELAGTIVSLTGSSSPIELTERPPADPERRRPDISRARRVLGWEPAVELEEGLTSTIEWAAAELQLV